MRATRSIDQKYGGLGVGLTLVRRLVELHGGNVQARSEGAGKGSEFIVKLPALPPQSDAAGPIVERRHSGHAARRILVVDDSLDNAETLAMALRTGEHEVEVADSGRLALQIAARFHPDAVIIDIGMPDMDGYELARRLREGPGTQSATLVALSGYGHDAARQEAWQAGFDEYFVKPVDINRIVELLDD
jgi:CheY-like chemotaxis protein